jgi:preprotein translocase subunit SecA
VDSPDVVFTHRAAKQAAVLDEIVRVHATERPILVGTASVAESEALAAALRERGVDSRVLNARHDAEEAAIVARAGEPGAVTISTNMAGRGTDIVLGGGAAAPARDHVRSLGGLYVIGTNRHESRRVDDQLRGRAGRQGDPGTSRFFICLEDDLISRYGVVALIPEKHRPAPTPGAVDDPIVHREIQRAQRIIEGQNFEIRKTLWQYSSMVDAQRQGVYRLREAWLTGAAEPAVCERDAPDHYRRLVATVGAEGVRSAERQLSLLVLDRHWSDHLALIDDIREGIHLQRYGGREPLQEFHKQLAAAFDAMRAAIDGEVARRFRLLTVADGRIDLSRAGIQGPASTWTYLINDDPFSSFGVSLIAGRNLGVSAAVGMIAVLYWPITLAIAARVLLRRWTARRP